MNQKIAHYSLIASTGLLAFVVIVHGFQKTNIESLIQIQNQTAAVADTHLTSIISRQKTLSICSDQKLLQAVDIFNSILSATSYPTASSACSTSYTDLFVNHEVLPSTLPANTNYAFTNTHTNLCKYPVSTTMAKSIVNFMSSKGVDVKYLIATSSLYIDWSNNPLNSGATSIADILSKGTHSGAKNPAYNYFPAPTVGYCFDQGYVSNYPNFVKKFLAFIIANPEVPNYNLKYEIGSFLSGRAAGITSYIDDSVVPSIGGQDFQTVRNAQAMACAKNPAIAGCRPLNLSVPVRTSGN